jgi:hypothetical protein
MPEMTVHPRETPAERADAPVGIMVDEALTVLAAQLDEWVAPMEHWELAYREGHEFGKANNVEARLLLAAPGHTCSLVFRLDQLEAIEEFDRELWLTLDERDGIARTVHLAPLGMDVELFRIVGPPLGGTAA